MISVDLIAEKIREKMPKDGGLFIIAIDGQSGVGKTTFAKQIAKDFEGSWIHCDDFFIGGRNEYWSKQSLTDQINKAINWERIRDVVLIPLRSGKKAEWHPFNWKKYEGLSDEIHSAEPKKLTVLDGAFTCRPELENYIDFKVLVRASAESRLARVKEREGKEYSDDWHATWQKAFDYYFTKISPPESFDLIIDN